MNQKEYELLADVFRGHLHSADVHVNKDVRATERDALVGTLFTLADRLQAEYRSFDRPKFMGRALHGVDDEGYPLCPTYGEKVMPDEHGNCSLCNKHVAW